jgi:hypothetical protein
MKTVQFAIAALLFPSSFAFCAGYEGRVMTLRRAAPLPAAVGRAARQIGRPRFASVTGSLGGAAFEAKLSRSLWLLSGQAGGQAIGVTIDHEGKSMLGDIGGRRVELAFHWTPARSLVQGMFDGAPLRYEVNFGDVSVAGVHARKPFRFALDAAKGRITGTIEGKAVRLDYNRVSGRLVGALGDREIDVTVVNMELGEFLQYYFLLLP